MFMIVRLYLYLWVRGLNAQGSNMLLQAIVKYFPSPDRLSISGKNSDTEKF